MINFVFQILMMDDFAMIVDVICNDNSIDCHI